MNPMTVDSFDLKDLGFNITEISGWRDGPTNRRTLVDLPQRIGKVVGVSFPSVQERVVTITGVLKAGSHSAVLLALDELQDRLNRDELQVIFGNQTTRFVKAYLDRFDTTGMGAAFVGRKIGVRFVLSCPDPRYYSTSVTQINGVGSSPTDVQVGTAISDPSLLEINGAATNPTITYKNEGGTTVETMTFGALSLSAGQRAEINCEDYTIKIFDPTERNGMDELTGGDFIHFRPEDADPWASTPDWPTIQISSGSLDVTYRKAYL